MRSRTFVRVSMMAVLIGLPAAPAGAARPPARAAGAHQGARSHRPAQQVNADFNGDGYADLAIGVPFEDVGTIVDAGAVNVLYGSPTGVQAVSPRNQFWTQDSPGVEDKAQAGDFFGWSLAAGDFNGDGYADLAIGAFKEDVLLESGSQLIGDAGAVNVLYGSTNGLQTDAPADQFWSQESPGMVGKAEHRDWFGYALSTGDYNGDGYADLAVGVQGEDGHFESIPRAGAVDVIYGSSAGLASKGNQHIDQDSPGMLGIDEPYDNFGNTLASADFNLDGYADLAVGVPFEDVHGLTDAGLVQVLYGTAATGLQADAPDDQQWSQESPGIQGSLATKDTFGLGLAAGDFNGDGVPDLAVGVPGEDVGGVTDAGEVQVLYGVAGVGLQVDAPDDQVWSQGTGGVQDQAEVGDAFGTSLAAGHFDGDAFSDLAIGVPLEDSDTTADVGAVAVLYGSAGGLQASAPDDQFWMQGTGGVTDTAEAGDQFGLSLFAADFDGNGTADLATGVPFEDTRLADVGAASVLYGAAAGGLQASSPDDQLWSQESPNVLDHPEVSDEFGWSVG